MGRVGGNFFFFCDVVNVVFSRVVKSRLIQDKMLNVRPTHTGDVIALLLLKVFTFLLCSKLPKAMQVKDLMKMYTMCKAYLRIQFDALQQTILI